MLGVVEPLDEAHPVKLISNLHFESVFENVKGFFHIYCWFYVLLLLGRLYSLHSTPEFDEAYVKAWYYKDLSSEHSPETAEYAAYCELYQAELLKISVYWGIYDAIAVVITYLNFYFMRQSDSGLAYGYAPFLPRYIRWSFLQLDLEHPKDHCFTSNRVMGWFLTKIAVIPSSLFGRPKPAPLQEISERIWSEWFEIYQASIFLNPSLLNKQTFERVWLEWEQLKDMFV